MNLTILRFCKNVNIDFGSSLEFTYSKSNLVLIDKVVDNIQNNN